MSPGIYDNVFMKKSINIANRLDEVNGIVAACNGSTMSFEQAYDTLIALPQPQYRGR